MYSPADGGFSPDSLAIEVGDKNKNASQAMHQDNYLIAADITEIGNGNKGPFWHFAFL